MIIWSDLSGPEYLTKVKTISPFTVSRLDAHPGVFPALKNAALEGVDPSGAADRLVAKVIPLGQRFYPSECAFPLRKCFLPLCQVGWRKKREVVDELSASRHLRYGAQVTLLIFWCASPWPTIKRSFQDGRPEPSYNAELRTPKSGTSCMGCMSRR